MKHETESRVVSFLCVFLVTFVNCSNDVDCFLDH